MPKHKHEDVNVDEIIDSINLDKGLRAGLSELNPDELTDVLADIANSANLSNADFKRARLDLPSFSTVKWFDFARQFGLPESTSNLNLVPFKTPRYLLPPSLHQAMFENAWRWQDVYRENVDQEREEARMRVLEPYIVPILALFQGRVVDMPGQAMVGSKYSAGGDVEHEIFMIGGVLFFIIEFKLGMPDRNNLAQLFLELLSAAVQNKKLNFAGLRIYGLLTNLIMFKFYSYDPTTQQFCSDESILVNTKRTDALYDMIDVSNKIFGVILSGYMDGLRAITRRSQDRAKTNDPASSSPGLRLEQNALSHPPSELTGERKKAKGRKSTDQWETALALAESCVTKFQEQVASLEDIEDRANGALELLTESVRSVPRASTFSGGDNDPSTPAELKALAARVSKQAHEYFLSKIGRNGHGSEFL